MSAPRFLCNCLLGELPQDGESPPAQFGRGQYQCRRLRGQHIEYVWLRQTSLPGQLEIGDHNPFSGNLDMELCVVGTDGRPGELRPDLDGLDLMAHIDRGDPVVERIVADEQASLP